MTLVDEKYFHSLKDMMMDYGAELLSNVPVRAIINFLLANQRSFSALLPSFMALTVNHFPQLFDTPNLLLPDTIQPAFDYIPPRFTHSTLPTEHEAHAILQSASSAALALLHKLHALAESDPEILLAYPMRTIILLLITPAHVYHNIKTMIL